MDWVAVGSIAAVVSAGAAVYAVLENRKGPGDGPRHVHDDRGKPENPPGSLPLDPPPPRGITWAVVANRRIKIATGGRTQSVNAGTDANIDGVYEWVVRLERPAFVSAEFIDARQFNSLEELKGFLVGECGGTLKPGRG